MIDGIGTIGPAISFVSSVLEQFKPNRSPYLLTVSGGILFILLTIDGDIDYQKQLLVLTPIFVFIFIISVLAFNFKPYTETDLKDSEKQLALEMDVDAQFKLARTTGLVTGIGCLFMIAKLRNNIDIIYILAWAIIVYHCVVYVIYILFRNIKEESISNRSYFQLSFMTALFLLTACYAAAKLDDDNFMYHSCISTLSWKNAVKNSDSGELKPVGDLQLTEGIPPCTTDQNTAAAKADIPDPHVITGSKTTEYISLRFCTFIFFTIMWLFYVVFWSVQLGRLWNKSKFVVGD